MAAVPDTDTDNDKARSMSMSIPLGSGRLGRHATAAVEVIGAAMVETPCGNVDAVVGYIYYPGGIKMG